MSAVAVVAAVQLAAVAAVVIAVVVAAVVVVFVVSAAAVAVAVAGGLVAAVGLDVEHVVAAVVGAVGLTLSNLTAKGGKSAADFFPCESRGVCRVFAAVSIMTVFAC